MNRIDWINFILFILIIFTMKFPEAFLSSVLLLPFFSHGIINTISRQHVYRNLEALTKPPFYGFVIPSAGSGRRLSAAKNLSLCELIETLRCAQGDKGEVMLECLIFVDNFCFIVIDLTVCRSKISISWYRFVVFTNQT